MYSRYLRGTLVVAIIGLLAGCGNSIDGKPPNVTTSAVVEKTEKTTRYNTAFGSYSTSYLLYLEDSPELRFVSIIRKIDEDALTRTIGGRVEIKCYRSDPKDYCYATNYQFQGRELLEASK
jgi:hypothetical protein